MELFFTADAHHLTDFLQEVTKNINSITVEPSCGLNKNLELILCGWKNQNTFTI